MTNLRRYSGNTIAIIFQWTLGYFSSVFLTLPILSSVAFGIVFYLGVFGEDVSFLQRFAGILPFSADGDLVMDGPAILDLFFKISLGIFLLKEIILFAARKITGQDYRLSFKKSFIWGLIVLILTHLPAVFVIPSLAAATSSTRSFLLFFEALMFSGAVGSYTIHAGIDFLSGSAAAYIRSAILDQEQTSKLPG